MLQVDFSHYKLRLMQEKDLTLIFEWRNNILVSKYMFNNHLISWEDHITWFKNSSSKNHLKLFILEIFNKPIAFFSFKIIETSKTAEWGFYKSPNDKNKIGMIICTLALKYAFVNLNVVEVIGKVKVNNLKSIDIHKKLGFRTDRITSNYPTLDDKHEEMVIFSLEKNNFLQN